MLHTRLNALASLQGAGETKPWRTNDGSDTSAANASDSTDIGHVAEVWYWQLPSDPFNLVKQYELQVYLTLMFRC